MVFTKFISEKRNCEISDLISKYSITSHWREGQPRRNGAYQSTGFSLDVPDSISWPEAEKKINEFMAENSELITDLIKLNMQSEFSVGLTVGSKESFIPCVEISLFFMQNLIDSRISLAIYAYPTNDE